MLYFIEHQQFTTATFIDNLTWKQENFVNKKEEKKANND